MSKLDFKVGQIQGKITLYAGRLNTMGADNIETLLNLLSADESEKKFIEFCKTVIADCSKSGEYDRGLMKIYYNGSDSLQERTNALRREVFGETTPSSDSTIVVSIDFDIIEAKISEVKALKSSRLKEAQEKDAATAARSRFGGEIDTAIAGLASAPDATAINAIRKKLEASKKDLEDPAQKHGLKAGDLDGELQKFTTAEQQRLQQVPADAIAAAQAARSRFKGEIDTAIAGLTKALDATAINAIRQKLEASKKDLEDPTKKHGLKAGDLDSELQRFTTAADLRTAQVAADPTAQAAITNFNQKVTAALTQLPILIKAATPEKITALKYDIQTQEDALRQNHPTAKLDEKQLKSFYKKADFAIGAAEKTKPISALTFAMGMLTKSAKKPNLDTKSTFTPAEFDKFSTKEADKIERVNKFIVLVNKEPKIAHDLQLLREKIINRKGDKSDDDLKKDIDRKLQKIAAKYSASGTSIDKGTLDYITKKMTKVVDKPLDSDNTVRFWNVVNHPDHYKDKQLKATKKPNEFDIKVIDTTTPGKPKEDFLAKVVHDPAKSKINITLETANIVQEDIALAQMVLHAKKCSTSGTFTIDNCKGREDVAIKLYLFGKAVGLTPKFNDDPNDGTKQAVQAFIDKAADPAANTKVTQELVALYKEVIDKPSTTPQEILNNLDKIKHHAPIHGKPPAASMS